MDKPSKTEMKKMTEEFFESIIEKNAEDVKKIKKLAMKSNIPLGEKRKLFCKKCLEPYKDPKIRIKNSTKIVTCQKCGNMSRWKLPED